MHSTDPHRPPGDARHTPCAEHDDHCALCGDDAVAMLVTAVDVRTNVAAALAGDRVVQVALDLVENVAAGDTLLVHQGFAIARMEDA